MKSNQLGYQIALALLGLAAQAHAQSGAALQGTTPPQPLPSDAKVLPAFPAASHAGKTAPGGTTVELKSVVISGNKTLDSETLLRQLGDVVGKRLDMAGLNALTDRLGAYYRAAGYPFTQVFLPPQDLKDGVLRISVVEGRYGVVSAAGKDPLPAGAQPFLEYGLKSGDAIQNQALERTMLILDDQPGMKISPVIKPGAHQGEGDLTVNVERISAFNGDLGFDNAGSKGTGEYRARGALFVNSPFRYGDKISLNGLYTNESMWLGSLDYELPLGPSGLRGQIGYAHTNYQLGGEFKSLDATGYARVSTLKLSYPLVRSQATNVLLSLGVQHKALQDSYGVSGTVKDKTSNGIPLGLQFDNRDNLAGGGVTYGSIVWLSGRLDLDATQTAADSASANSQGHFNKLNIDVARIQKLPGNFNLYGRYSGQLANKNLDSSEKFNLGGFYGVRAYPLGEGTGDKGFLAQLEIRYAFDTVTPFLFYDFGQSHTNAQPWDGNSAAVRNLAGSGLGLRTGLNGWTIESTLAWRMNGGVATADNVDRNPRIFFMLGRKF